MTGLNCNLEQRFPAMDRDCGHLEAVTNPHVRIPLRLTGDLFLL